MSKILWPSNARMHMWMCSFSINDLHSKDGYYLAPRSVGELWIVGDCVLEFLPLKKARKETYKWRAAWPASYCHFFMYGEFYFLLGFILRMVCTRYPLCRYSLCILEPEWMLHVRVEPEGIQHHMTDAPSQVQFATIRHCHVWVSNLTGWLWDLISCGTCMELCIGHGIHLELLSGIVLWFDQPCMIIYNYSSFIDCVMEYILKLYVVSLLLYIYLLLWK